MRAPLAEAGMLIRRDAGTVFEAFRDPAQTTRFWFDRSTGSLAEGARVTWTWSVYGASTLVVVKTVEPGRRIIVDWDVETTPTEVEWLFEPHPKGCWTTVANRGFAATDDGVASALDSAGGLALVLAGVKIWLEHGVEPHFVRDRHPSAWQSVQD